MRRLLTLFVLLLSFAAGSAFAQQFSSLEERMTEAEFKAAGLDKLSPEELAALNAWLAGRVATGATAAAAPVEDRRGFLSAPDADEGDIVSSISGTFRGWEGRGFRFTLANGQIWESVEAGKLVVNMENPTVIISPGMLNSWSLRVEGYNSRIRVKRIK